MIINKKLSSNFLKMVLTVVFIFSLFSCNDLTPSSDAFPLVVVAKGNNPNDDFYDCVTLKTKNGNYVTYSTGNSDFARAINDTYKVGDTVR